MTNSDAFKHVPPETATLSKCLRQTLLGLGFEVRGNPSFASPHGKPKPGELHTPKTIINLAFEVPAARSKAIELLAECGIVAQKGDIGNNDAKLVIDSTQEGLADNIVRLQDAHKDTILSALSKLIDNLPHTAHCANLIPTRPDGKALDVDFAAQMLARDLIKINKSAEDLGVGQHALRAAASPRDGRSRAVGEGSEDA